MQKDTITSRTLFFLWVIGVMLFSISSCRRTDNYSVYRRPISVKIIRLDSVSTFSQATYIGKVEESSSMQLRFPMGGTVSSVNVHKNQRVSKGQVLTTIDDLQPRQVLATAQATLAQAQDAYNRLKQVYDKGALPQVQWVEIQTQLEKAQAMVEIAKQQVADCTLRAPEDGIIDECDIRVGQQLLPSQTAIRLINIDGVQIVFAVPEHEIANLKIGTEVEIVVPALGESTLIGTISEKDITCNPLTHSYNARVNLTNPNKELIPGMVCNVSIVSSKDTGFVVPSQCIQTTKGGTAIWLETDGKAHRQIVECAAFVEGGVLINKGLSAGDRVIVSGYQKLYEGAEIEVAE